MSGFLICAGAITSGVVLGWSIDQLRDWHESRRAAKRWARLTERVRQRRRATCIPESGRLEA